MEGSIGNDMTGIGREETTYLWVKLATEKTGGSKSRKFALRNRKDKPISYGNKRVRGLAPTGALKSAQPVPQFPKI